MVTKENSLNFDYACLGGTFDRMHGGHKLLLRVAFKLSKRVLIGITTDELARRGKKIPDLIYDYKKRVSDVMEYLKSIGVAKKRIDIRPLSRATQYADEIAEIGLIVISPETYGRVLEINDIRRSKGLDELIGVAIPYYRDENGKIVSSQTSRELELKLAQQKKQKDDDARLE